MSYNIIFCWLTHKLSVIVTSDSRNYKEVVYIQTYFPKLCLARAFKCPGSSKLSGSVLNFRWFHLKT